MFLEHNGFKNGKWTEEIDVRDFIVNNYCEYVGDESFLKPATDRTKNIMNKLNSLFLKEKNNSGVLDIDTENVSSILSHKEGYIDKENEIIVGIQTDSPLKRSVNPFGGIRMTRDACNAYGRTLSNKVEESFKYRTTHNDGVFRVYNEEMLLARKVGLITGLPDAYGRGRIIGDYRRVALYGVDFLINKKINDKKELSKNVMKTDNIRKLEELFEQISFLKKIKRNGNYVWI